MADTEENIAEDEEEQTDDIEVQARDMGWMPEEDFKGDPAKWTPAAEWVHKGENYIPIIRKRLSDSEKKTSRLEAEQAQLKSDYQGRFAQLEKMQSAALIQQRDQLVSQFGAQKRDAVERGDTDAYDQVEQAERVALSDLAKTTDQAAPPQSSSADDAAVKPWLKQQKWFGADKAMTAFASALSGKITEERPWLYVEENLDEVLADVKKRFSDSSYFGNSKEQRGSPVEGGSRTGGISGRSGLYSKLPKEAKDQCDSQIKDGLFARGDDGKPIEDNAKRRERYAKLYFGDDNE